MAKRKTIKLEISIDEAAVLAEAAITFKESRAAFVRESPKNFHPMKDKYQKILDKLGKRIASNLTEEQTEKVWDYDSHKRA